MAKTSIQVHLQFSNTLRALTQMMTFGLHPEKNRFRAGEIE